MKPAWLLWGAAPAAQTADLKSLDRLAAKAQDGGGTNVSLDGLRVRHFEFERGGAYSDGDLEGVRAQLRGPGWSKVVDAKDRKGKENPEVYVHSGGGTVTGFVVVAAEPRELTVVYAKGPLDLPRLKDVAGRLGK
jgi:hypothetical protein